MRRRGVSISVGERAIATGSPPYCRYILTFALVANVNNPLRDATTFPYQATDIRCPGSTNDP
jgi:hypothetical protein